MPWVCGRFAGTGVLLRHAARRDRWRVLLWSLALRPQRFFVPVQLALRQVERAAQPRLDAARQCLQRGERAGNRADHLAAHRLKTGDLFDHLADGISQLRGARAELARAGLQFDHAVRKLLGTGLGGRNGVDKLLLLQLLAGAAWVDPPTGGGVEHAPPTALWRRGDRVEKR